MRQSLLWALLLLQGVSVTCAEPHIDIPGADNVHPLPGSDLVDAALAKLSSVPNQPYLKQRRQGSMFATALRFIMKAAPSLSMRGPPPQQPKQQQHAATHAVPANIADAVQLLQESSSRYNNPDALYILADMNYYGNYSHPRNFPVAFDYYNKLADAHGNSSAMYMMGLMYSTGIGGAVEQDQARALLYYTFAALQGHTRAEMTVASRHHAGIGTPRSCEEAVKYYKRVADKAMAWFRSGPPGGMSWVMQPYRIADEVGGLYGEGASAVSSGINALRAQPSSDAYASIEDVIEYLDLMAQKGDFKAALNIGRIYYEGQRGLDRDMAAARKYFLMVASKFWSKNGRAVDNAKPGLDKTAGKAAGYLGRMNLAGEGLEEPNYERAKSWFEMGVSMGDAQSQYYLGLMHLHGYGNMKKNGAMAIEMLIAAADQDYWQAQVEIGVMHLDQGEPEDIHTANDYFEKAARYGYTEAYYYLAEMIHNGLGRDKSCAPALLYYKSVAERADPLVSSWTEANQAYEAGDFELALLEYLEAAEQGYEKAQNNIGYLLDPQQSTLPLPSWLVRPSSTKTGLLDNPAMGLVHFTRSSRQNNVDALVKMGDYYLNGIGTDKNVDKAVQCYTGASEYHQSAQALYNLGWMHENGVGLDQDFHLAKRYYDIALATNEEAFLPVTLSLLKLRLRSAWNTLTHGQINSIQDEPAPSRKWSFSEWMDTFWNSEYGGLGDFYDDLYGDDEYLDEGFEDFDDFDDLSFLEPFAIVGLVMGIAFLLYYRQQRQLVAQNREREEEEDAQRQQHLRQQIPDGVLPPPI